MLTINKLFNISQLCPKFRCEKLVGDENECIRSYNFPRRCNYFEHGLEKYELLEGVVWMTHVPSCHAYEKD
jgi:hypothetical protein